MQMMTQLVASLRSAAMEALQEQQVDTVKAAKDSLVGPRQRIYLLILAACFVVCAAAVGLVLWNDVKSTSTKEITLKIMPTDERQVEALAKIDSFTNIQIIPLETLSARLVTTYLHRFPAVQKMLHQHHINYTIVNNGTDVL